MNRHWLFPYMTDRTPPICSRVLADNHPYRSTEGFYEFKESELKNYANYDLNWHHLTTDTIWNVVFPAFMEQFNLDYNKDDYEYIKFIADNQDLSYHEFKGTMNVEVHFNNKIVNRLRDVNGNWLTAYHRLYIAAHQISTIINHNSLTDRVLKLNCDSMVIPLIPLIVPYFKKIYVIDYRDNYVHPSYDDVTDELTAYITFNINRIYHT